MKFINKNDFVSEDYKLEASNFLQVRLEQPKPILLDIRPLEASSKGTFIGAHQLPADSLEDRLIQLPPFGTIILYSDDRDTDVETSLKLLWENGFTEILYVEGGLNAILKAMVRATPFFSERFPDHYRSAVANRVAEPALKLEIRGFDYGISLVRAEDETEGLFRIQYDGFSAYFEPKVFRLIESTELRWSDSGPSVHHPRMDMEKPAGSLEERVKNVLDEMVNPSVAMHGGYVSLLEIKDDTAYIEMGGGCQGCGMSQVTLKNGIENTIFDHVPEITQVFDVTDHASGTNPYYRGN